MIVCVTGGRTYDNYPFVCACLDAVHKIEPTTLLIHGGCQVWDKNLRRFVDSGADWQADQWAVLSNVKRRVFKAHWGEFGREAGPIRNEEMADFLAEQTERTLCVAFEGGAGTANMVNVCRRDEFKIPVWKTWLEPLRLGVRQLTLAV